MAYGEAESRDTSRMEAFSDAVIAIAITLPIVSIDVPQVGPGTTLALELARLWPSYLGYLLSVIVIGLYWCHHHFNGMIYKRVSHYFLLVTLLFLMALAFIPFPTRVFAEYVQQPEQRVTGAVYYVASLAIVSASWLLKWLYACYGGMVDERIEPAFIRRMTIRYVVASAILVIAIPITAFVWQLGLAIAGITTLYYVKSPPAPEYRTN